MCLSYEVLQTGIRRQEYQRYKALLQCCYIELQCCMMSFGNYQEEYLYTFSTTLSAGRSYSIQATHIYLPGNTSSCHDGDPLFSPPCSKSFCHERGVLVLMKQVRLGDLTNEHKSVLSFKWCINMIIKPVNILIVGQTLQGISGL